MSVVLTGERYALYVVLFILLISYLLSVLMMYIDTVVIITSGKNFIKITSVGMGAAKSNETR